MALAPLLLLETELAEFLRTSSTIEGRCTIPLIGPPTKEPDLPLPLLAPSDVMAALQSKIVEVLWRVDVVERDPLAGADQ